jgi:uncharacterized membrane protein
MDICEDKDQALADAFREARTNGRGHCFAVFVPANPNYPEGAWFTTMRKPMTRTREWQVIECTADGRTLLA